MGSIVAEIADKIASAGGGERSELEVRGGIGAAGGGILTLSTSELTVVDGDILGRIDFQAPLETGTDAIVVSASIYAEADDAFAADNNSTELVFAVGASEAAAEKMRLDHDGQLGIGTATPAALLTVEGTIKLKEQSAAVADTASYGQLWVDDAVKSPLFFTNDAGDDIGITTGSVLNAASLGGVLPVGVTGGSGLTALGTIAAATTFSDTITANDLIISGDPSLDTGWVDYYESSTKSGWNNIVANRKWIWSKKIGSVVFIVFHLEGTSNATTKTFTLPYTMNTWPSSQVSYTNKSGWSYDNGSTDADSAHINIDSDGSSTARINRVAGNWTTSGTAIVAGQFCYPTNET